MNCEKCGYCCIHYDIILPIDPVKGIVEGNMTQKNAGEYCHFMNDDGTCSVHELDWYKETSCHHYDYGDGAKCPMTPGPILAQGVRRISSVVKHDCSKHGSLSQEMLMLLHHELVEKNKQARIRLDLKRNKNQ